MKIHYELNLEDNVNFYVYQIKTGINPVLNTNLKRWNMIIFWLLVVLLPICEFLVTNETMIGVVTFIICLIIFGIINYKNNLKKFWMKFLKRAYRRNLKVIFFDKEKLMKMDFLVDKDSISIESEYKKTIYKEKNITLVDADENYYYIFFKKNMGTLIPKKFVSQENTEWFKKQIRK